MSKLFKGVPSSKPKLNAFDLSAEKKLSAQMGNLYPILFHDIVPGDSFKGKSEIMARLAPMVAPAMVRANIYTHTFFVPKRLLWNEFESHITGGESGTEEPVYPKLTIDEANKEQFGSGSLADFLGVPVTTKADGSYQTIPPEANLEISALPFRACALIYNEYFRDQNLEEKIPFSLGSDAQTDITELTTMRQRAWEKDYFTSALPWSQRGGEAQIPLGTVEPVYKQQSEVKYDAGAPVANETLATDASGGLSTGSSPSPIRLENLDAMSVDATTINDLRKANALQVWLEKSARGGSRYAEQILSFFGVHSSDSRLQRPEYLGGGRQPIVISEVLNTVGVQGQAPQGEMAGHGISVGTQGQFKKRAEEHGYIISFMSVIPKPIYKQGLAKHWQKFDKFDNYFPQFAHLGEQEVKVSELFNDYQIPTVDKVFGYQQRYAEYKYQQGQVHGEFRDNLEYWTMVREFANEPTLSKEFVMTDPALLRNIFAVQDLGVDTMYIQIYNNVKALRPMPYFSIPSL